MTLQLTGGQLFVAFSTSLQEDVLKMHSFFVDSILSNEAMDANVAHQEVNLSALSYQNDIMPPWNRL